MIREGTENAVRRWLIAALVGPAVIGLVVLLLFMAVAGSALGSGGGGASVLLAAKDAALTSQTCNITIDPKAAAGNWNAEQKTNAAAIVSQVKVDVTANDQAQAAVVALATAMQESSLINIGYGDQAGPDSRGLFQQREPWGPLAQRMDPHGATHLFLTVDKGPGVRGLLHVPGWQSMPVTEAAQAVQVSAFPLAYAKWEGQARQLAASLLGAVPTGDPCGGAGGAPAANVPANVAAMLGYAKSLLGTPYVWGGTTYPPGVDCSGLLVYAWGHAGHPLAIRTSQEMFTDSTPVQYGKEQAGNLVFSEFDASGPGHVMIVLDPAKHQLIEAPHTGDVVKIISYDQSTGSIGRLTAAAFTGGKPA